MRDELAARQFSIEALGLASHIRDLTTSTREDRRQHREFSIEALLLHDA